MRQEQHIQKSASVWLAMIGALTLRDARAECLRYNVSFTLTGTVVSHQGLRGWWGLKLEKPLCTVEGRVDAYEVAYSSVGETQTAIMNNQDLRPFMGEKVAITGKLFPRMNGHHQTSKNFGLNISKR